MDFASSGEGKPHRIAFLLSQIVMLSIPVLLFAYFNLIDPLPWFAFRKYDPEMAYMLNSLAILKSRPYMYYHHPGAPLMVAGSAILLGLRTIWQLPGEGFIARMLANPRSFFLVAYAVPTAFSSAVIALLLRQVDLRASRAHVLSGFAVAASLLAGYPAEAMAVASTWNQNYLSLPLGTGLLLLFWIRLRKGAGRSLLELTAFGLAAGVLWSLQYYLLAWAVGAVVIAGLARGLSTGSLMAGLAGSLAAAVGTVVGFSVSFLPLVHRLREYVWWMRGLVGPNTSGLPSLAEIVQALIGLWEGHWVLLGFLIVSVGLFLAAAVVSRSRERDPAWWAVGAGTLVVLAVVGGAILMAALSGRARATYLLPVAATVPVFLALAMEELLSAGARWRWVAAGVSVLLLGGLIVGLLAAVRGHAAQLRELNAAETAIEEVIERAASQRNMDSDRITVLWTHGSASPCYGLRFANIYTEGAFEREIDQLCPRDWAYFPWSDQVSSTKGIDRFTGTEGWDLLIGPAHMPAGIDGLGTVGRVDGLGLTYVVKE